MPNVLLDHLFTAFRNDDRLTKSGIGEYLILQEFIAKAENIENFEDFAFACQIVLAKAKAEKLVCREILSAWRLEIEKYITEQYTRIDQIKHPRPSEKKQENTSGIPGGAPIAQPDVVKDEKTIKPLVAQDTSEKPSQTSASTGTREGDDNSEEEGHLSLSVADDSVAPDANNRRFNPGKPDMPGDMQKTFFFGTEYFPIANRNLQQTWRGLKSRQKNNVVGNIDILGTIDKTSRTGLLTGYEYQKKIDNLLVLFIFIDRGASMASAEAFGSELANSAKQSGAHPDIKPYYFQGIPEPANDENSDYYLLNEDETESFTTSGLFKKYAKKNIVVILYSDCGALSLVRSDVAKKYKKSVSGFLRYLLKTTAYAVWVNPAPKLRWTNTSAGDITMEIPEIPMFEANNIGMKQAINALKGKIVTGR